MEEKLYFASDYMEGAHPAILKRLLETNMEKTAGYGLDEYSEAARDKIRAACKAPEADVFFLSLRPVPDISASMRQAPSNTAATKFLRRDRGTRTTGS